MLTPTGTFAAAKNIERLPYEVDNLRSACNALSALPVRQCIAPTFQQRAVKDGLASSANRALSIYRENHLARSHRRASVSVRRMKPPNMRARTPKISQASLIIICRGGMLRLFARRTRGMYLTYEPTSSVYVREEWVCVEGVAFGCDISRRHPPTTVIDRNNIVLAPSRCRNSHQYYLARNAAKSWHFKAGCTDGIGEISK